MKQFENMTIGELKKLHDQFRAQNPEFKTAEELLEDLSFKDIYPNQRK